MMTAARLAVAGFALLLMGVYAPAFAQDAGAGAITWRVLDRFRFFADEDPGGERPPARLGRSDQLMAPVYDAYGAGPLQGAWVATEWMAFAQTASNAAFATAEVEAPGQAASAEAVRLAHNAARQAARYFRWDRRTDTYDGAYVLPRRYWIEARLAGAGGEACTWRVRSADSPAPSEVSAPCSRAVLPVPAVWATAQGRAGRHRATIEAQASQGAVSRIEIEIHDRLVVAIGDSVASGEGNPDVASDWRGLAEPRVLAELQESGGGSGAGWFMTREAAESVAGAVWFDEQCHRSLNSWPARTAMALAAEDPHGAVTFVSFACGGASTYDGILFPQDKPPGGEVYTFAGGERVRSRAEETNPSGVALAVAGGAAPRLGQIDAIARLLCERTTPLPINLYREVEREGSWRVRVYPSAVCANPVRDVSTLLVTLGGNDVGFAEGIIWSIVPRAGRNPIEGLIYGLANDGLEGRKCPRRITGDPGCSHAAEFRDYTWGTGATPGDCRTGQDGLPVAVRQRRPTGQYLATCFLPVALRDTRAALARMGPSGIAPAQQVWTAYPAAFWRGRENQVEIDDVISVAPDDRDQLRQFPNYSWLCGRDETLPERVVENGEEESRALLALYGGADGVGRLPVGGWVMNQFTAPDFGIRIMRWESNETAQYLYAPLVARLQREFGDRLVDDYLGDPIRPDEESDWRGWCARSDDGPAAEGLFPRLRTIHGRARWARGYEPWDWRPYERTPRLFRSPSDSALTQFPGPDFRGQFSLGVMADRFGDSVSGMLHPNAEAHGIIANEAITKIRSP
jgi:hypothetical protein